MFVASAPFIHDKHVIGLASNLEARFLIFIGKIATDGRFAHLCFPGKFVKDESAQVYQRAILAAFCRGEAATSKVFFGL